VLRAPGARKGRTLVDLWQQYRDVLWGGRRWILASFALFIAGSVSGYGAASTDPDGVRDLIAPLIQMVASVGAQVVKSGDPLVRTWLIFRNNASAITQFVALGSFAGLVPAVDTFANGAVLGVMAALQGDMGRGKVSSDVLIAGIAPHAVFELPALWLASAWGMKLGLSWLMPAANGRRLVEWRETAAEAAYVLVLSAALLAVAAAIEGNVTLALVQWLRS
jgi:stage II sporulation protein M